VQLVSDQDPVSETIAGLPVARSAQVGEELCRDHGVLMLAHTVTDVQVDDGLKRRVRVFIAFNGASQRLVTVVLRRISGAYSLQARTRRDDGTRADTGFFAISNASHLVEFDWRRATAPGANNGWLIFYIDGVPVNTLAGLDNDGSPVESARLGVMTIKTPAAGGSVLFDQFESRRVRYIGPEL